MSIDCQVQVLMTLAAGDKDFLPIAAIRFLSGIISIEILIITLPGILHLTVINMLYMSRKIKTTCGQIMIALNWILMDASYVQSIISRNLSLQMLMIVNIFWASFANSISADYVRDLLVIIAQIMYVLTVFQMWMNLNAYLSD